MKTRSTLLLAALCAAPVFSAFAQEPRTFTGQYSFGDSLSDTGNLYALTNRTQPPAPYFQGRFSSGPVFTELLGNPIVPAVQVSAAGSYRNFAFGGASAGGSGTPPNFAGQIAAYRLQGLPARETDLFTVLFGANDLIPVLSAPTTPANPGAIDQAGVSAAQTVAAGVQSLVGLGARNLVVGGLPNLGATPRSLAAGGPGGAGAAFGLRATSAFNNDLRARLASIAAATPDANLVYVDLQGILDRVIADYAALGFSNATAYYLAPAAQGGGAGDPNGYVFWDDIHPTSRTHALLAAVITEQLNPEIPLSFTSTLGSAALALQGLGATAVDARTSLLAVSERPPGRGDVYASFNYAEGGRSRDGWRPRFDYRARVVTAGADFRIGEGLLAGAALNGGRLKAELSGARGDFTVEDVTGRLYGVWRGGPVSLILDGDYGTLTVKRIRRATALGGLPAHGKTSGNHWGVGIKAAWAVDVGPVNVRPWLGLRTHRVEIKGYTETDIPALAMQFEEQEAESTSAAIGVDASTSWKLGGRVLRLDVRGAWRGEFGNDERDLTGRLADNFTRPASIVVDDGDGDGVELGGALTLFFARNWSGSLGYAADLRFDDKVAHRGTFSIQTGF